MTVTFDVAALPTDGRFRFDDERVEYAESSKNEMKLYICRQLRCMLESFERLNSAASEVFPARSNSKRQRHDGAGTSTDPVSLSPQQLSQVNYYVPASQQQTSSAN
eukprot:1032932-Pleurochrysis_carterae.AAC.1